VEDVTRGLFIVKEPREVVAPRQQQSPSSFSSFSVYSLSLNTSDYTHLGMDSLSLSPMVCSGYIATTRITPCPRSYKKKQHLPRRLDLSSLVSLSDPLIPTATKSQKQEKKTSSCMCVYIYKLLHDMPSSPESIISSDSLLISHLDKKIKK